LPFASKFLYFLSNKIKKNGIVDIIYLGSPDYSKKLVEELSKKHKILSIISNPDKISDRSRKPKPTPVSEFAIENQIPLYRPDNLKENQFLNEIKKLSPDIGVVFSYGKILPESFYTIPKYGCINLHGSLLPDLRGPSPLQTSILKGYKKSGWTVQKISKGMDEGDILAQREFEIDPNETTGELLERVLPLGIKLVMEVLDNLLYYLENAKKQDSSKATYCYKIKQEDTIIDWRKDSVEIHNLVRALNPNPIAKTNLKKNIEIVKNIKIYKTNFNVNEEWISYINPSKEIQPGMIFFIKQNKKNYLFVKTGNSWLEILEIQYPNKKKLNAHDFINGNFVQQGDMFI
jgi:methionyl-tRNA formyltransferase